MKTNQNTSNISHPLFATSTVNWIKLLTHNQGFDSEFIIHAIFLTLTSILTIPLRFLSKILYRKKIEKTKIKKPPIFIIGHWRSGTTYLHELISQDPKIGYISLWQTLLPNSCLLLDDAKKIFSRFLPSTRPMDKIKVDINGPYEEEAALAVLDRWSFFHCFHFPKNAEEQYLKSVHFEGLKEKEIKKWKKNYIHLLKTATLSKKGKQLVIKNPSNTARIKTLLELFPHALFIHIYRNPYKVYASTIKMRTRVLDKLALQNSNHDEIKKQVIDNYKLLMKKYFKQKNLIPEKNLIEIRYEDLVSNPLYQIQKIYQKLDISKFKEAKPSMKLYLKRKADYKTNSYNFNHEIIQKVNKNWSFTIKKWGYKPPE